MIVKLLFNDSHSTEQLLIDAFMTEWVKKVFMQQHW